MFILLDHLVTPALLEVAQDVTDTHRIHNLEEVGNQEGEKVGVQWGAQEVANEEEALGHCRLMLREEGQQVVVRLYERRKDVEQHDALEED